MQWRFATQHESNFSSSSTMWKFFHDHQVGHARKFSKIVLFFYTDQNFYRLLYYGQKYLPTFLLPTKISTEYFSKNTIITVHLDNSLSSSLRIIFLRIKGLKHIY